MIHNAKDLSPGQRSVLEALLGRSISKEEAISVRAARPADAPEWLENSWKTAQQASVDTLTAEEIEAEIAAARRDRPARQ